MSTAEPNASNVAACLRTRALSVVLSGRRVLDAVDFEARSGEITALVGPNGAGKTTLLRALCGLLPAAGRIEFTGADATYDLSALGPHERATTIAYVPQRSELVSALAVIEVVRLARFAFTRHGARDPAPERVSEALAACDLATLAERSYTELSGGQQRRVLLARALATGARVLLLDEPTASLDLGHACDLFALLHQLAARGYVLVTALHRLNDVFEHAARTVVLDAGRVIVSNTTHAALNESVLAEVFGLEMMPKHDARFQRRARS